MTVDGDYPDASKFDMIRDWKISTTGQSLQSFVGLVILYQRYAPYLKMRIKLLRKLLKTYFRKNTPAMALSPDLVEFSQI